MEEQLPPINTKQKEAVGSSSPFCGAAFIQQRPTKSNMGVLLTAMVSDKEVLRGAIQWSAEEGIC